VSRLAAERRETDNDLSSERAESDDVLATRDEVLQIVSHDLRNLLGTVIGMAGLIEEDGDPSGGDTGTVGRARWIMRAAGRMNRLVGDLTDAASIEAGTLALTCRKSDAAAIADEAVGTFQDLAAERNIALVTDIRLPLPSGWFDSARIYQVITNLLSNAIKFTPRGGKVVVRVECVNEEIRFAVSDTGIGIASGLLTRVFTRNVQLAANDRRGAGLGLYISRSLVKRHGGRIWAESTPAEGTTFFFTVPLSKV
jgi:signal transduction histidine kinase